MKRIRKTAVPIILAVVLLLVLAGCGTTATESGSQTQTTAGQTGTTASQTDAADGYAFIINGITIRMHAETAPILEQLGEPKSYFEAESCAFPGLEKTYTYPSFNLYTYEDGDKDRVASLVILDDSVGTAEGIYLDSSLEDVLKQYGDDYTHSLNLYSFESGQMKLSFIIGDDVVTSIEYIALSGEDA